MTEIYSKAQFWKCALQVNPSEYINYRGQDHGLSEEEYNRELLRVCQEQGIKVIGLADHGSVDGVEAIRSIFKDSDVILFPGFEITSSEKIHFVCLFPENTDVQQLERILGNLALTDPSDCISPSSLNSITIIDKIHENNGFIYAAHCIHDSGILFEKFDQIWKYPKLQCTQIPKRVEDLKSGETNKYFQILKNKDPYYSREKPIAIINAKDVAKPSDLEIPESCCLVKMTKPTFESFKLAFQDPESRICLISTLNSQPHSRIEAIKITHGYLDETNISFSEHLNTIIGGRGTGKSTLIECIRYALDCKIISKSAKKTHDEIIKQNIGSEESIIELTVKSPKTNGKNYKISRKFNEKPIVLDEVGNESSFEPCDIFPNIEVFGQNEIYDITKDNQDQLGLLERFPEIQTPELDEQINNIHQEIEDIDTQIQDLEENRADIETDVIRLPKLIEKQRYFSNIGLDIKLNTIPKVERERTIVTNLQVEIERFHKDLKELIERIPNSDLITVEEIKQILHKDHAFFIRDEFSSLYKEIKPLLENVVIHYADKEEQILTSLSSLDNKISDENVDLLAAMDNIQEYEGKNGREIGIEYQRLLREIERIKPLEKRLENADEQIREFENRRANLIDELSQLRDRRFTKQVRGIGKINEKLAGNLRITIEREGNREPLINLLLSYELDQIGKKRLSCFESASNFSPIKLASFIREGKEKLLRSDWSIIQSVADSLCGLKNHQIREIEEISLPNKITIELNVAHDGSEIFRPLDKLSTGQRCTAILHLLLLEYSDPLIIDQPEDNLDNAFIAERIVKELRTEKNFRQFIFATHNANIPVFGDAEWIGVFESDGEQATISEELQGSIDSLEIQQMASSLLEGGKEAFILRKEKYGY